MKTKAVRACYGTAGRLAALDPAVVWKTEREGKLESLDEDVSRQKVEGVAGLFLAVCGKMWGGSDKLLEELSSKRGAELGSVGMQHTQTTGQAPVV